MLSDGETPARLLGSMLLPPDPSRGSVVEAGADWELELPRLEGLHAVVWGRGPEERASDDPVAHLRRAAARERALIRLRAAPPQGWQVTGVHRLGPTRTHGGIRRVARRALLDGVLVELWRAGVTPVRRLDRTAAVTPAAHPIRRVHLGGAGTAISRVRLRTGEEALFRAAPVSTTGDPARAFAGLERCRVEQVPSVPRPLGAGTDENISWTLESLVSGHPPGRLTPSLRGQVARWIGGLPASGPGARSLDDDLRVMVTSLPDRSEPVTGLGNEARRLLPAVAVLGHGDLWRANLLVREHRLAGVVDWDLWHPHAPPGVDLVHLLIVEELIRGRSLAEAWQRRPWGEEPVRTSLRTIWRSVGAGPCGDDEFDALAVTAWVALVAGALRRRPDRAQDERWLADHVDPLTTRWR